jgi:CDGSH-type Zn-finger protein
MAAARITVRNNGSLRVEGDFEIVDHEGRPFTFPGRAHVSLCRCGQSARKPFCDGAHRICGFRSEVVAFELEPPDRTHLR